MKYIFSLSVFAICSIAQAIISPDQTLVSISNTSSETVEVRIKAEFAKLDQNSVKTGEVRVTIQPESAKQIDLKLAAERSPKKKKKGKGNKGAEQTVKNFDEIQFSSIKILKIVALDDEGDVLCKVITAAPKKKKKKSEKEIVSELAQEDALIVVQDATTGDFKVTKAVFVTCPLN
jgi:hypothetical protein